MEGAPNVPVIQVEDSSLIEEESRSSGETVKASASRGSDNADAASDFRLVDETRFADTGDGFDEDSQPEISEPFFITEEEIELAFKFFSGDGKRITREDLKRQLDLICPNLSLKDYKLFLGGTGNGTRKAGPGAAGGPGAGTGGGAFGGKDGDDASDLMGLRELKNLLLNKDLSELAPLSEAYRLLERSERNTISEPYLRRLLKKMDPREFVYKNDYDTMIRLFDTDEDGLLGFDDFVQITRKATKE